MMALFVSHPDCNKAQWTHYKSPLNLSIDLYDHRKLWSHLDCHDRSHNLYRKGNSNRHRTKASSTTALLMYYFLQTSFIFCFKHTNPNTDLKQNKNHYVYERKSTDRQHQQGLYQYIAFYSDVFHTYRSRNEMTFCRLYWPLSAETPRAGRACVDYHWWE